MGPIEECVLNPWPLTLDASLDLTSQDGTIERFFVFSSFVGKTFITINGTSMILAALQLLGSLIRVIEF